MSSNISKPSCKKLILDAGPLLSLSPLRGLAETYITVPQVLVELKDKRAREHFEKLGLSAGVKIEVKEPDAVSLAHVMQFAKKTGDYSVLSHADLCILALTYLLDQERKAEKLRLTAQSQSESSTVETPDEQPINNTDQYESSTEQTTLEEKQSDVEYEHDDSFDASEHENVYSSYTEEDSIKNNDQSHDQELPDVTIEKAESEVIELDLDVPSLQGKVSEDVSQNTPVLFEDPSDEEDDGEGEWITPANVVMHKSRALALLPSTDSSESFTTVSRKSKRRELRFNNDSDYPGSDGPSEQIYVGCMTADFAMQNVLLQMGLNLVGVEGKRIRTVKSWVLRCHACFKICKDNTKKFCPSCGNPTLLRATVTTSSDGITNSNESGPDKMQVHLKKNFTYRTRGTIYSIPSPKPGSSKTGPGEGLILREDQTEYVRAKKRIDGKKEREDKKLIQGALNARKQNSATSGIAVGSWMDPDWVPEIISVGIGGKGRTLADSSIGRDGLPVIGYGRKNPNEKKRRK